MKNQQQHTQQTMMMVVVLVDFYSTRVKQNGTHTENTTYTRLHWAGTRAQCDFQSIRTYDQSANNTPTQKATHTRTHTHNDDDDDDDTALTICVYVDDTHNELKDGYADDDVRTEM